MLTIIDICQKVGLCPNQTRKYLAIAVQEIERKQLLKEGEILAQTIGRKDFYHPVVVEEIKQGINHVQRTRYSRSANTRKQRLRCDRQEYKSA